MIFIVHIIAVSRVFMAMAQSRIPYSACLMKPNSPGNSPIMQSQRTKCAVVPVSAVLVNSKGSNEVCNDLTVTSSDVSHMTSTGDGTAFKRECSIDEISVPNVLQSTDTHDISDTTSSIQYITVSTSLEDLNVAESSKRHQKLHGDSSDSFLSDMDVAGLIGDDKTAGTVNRKRTKKHDDKRARKESKPARPKPNSFVAVRISSPVIRERLKDVQDAMVKHDKQLTKVLTSLQKLHITLMVIRMETDDEIEIGRKALNEASELISTRLQGGPLLLMFKGLGTFGSKVVFADVVDGLKELEIIAGIVQDVFQRNGLKSTEKRKTFTPHVTIAKVSKSRMRSIPVESFTDCIDIELGLETITSLELLSMTEPPTAEGYYFTYETTHFTNSTPR